MRAGSNKAEASRLLRKAGEDVLVVMALPKAPWMRIYSTNVLERLSKEVNRHTKVAEIILNNPVIRLVGASLVGADDKWQILHRSFNKESMRQLYQPDFSDLAKPTSLRLAQFANEVISGTERQI